MASIDFMASIDRHAVRAYRIRPRRLQCSIMEALIAMPYGRIAYALTDCSARAEMP